MKKYLVILLIGILLVWKFYPSNNVSTDKIEEAKSYCIQNNLKSNYCIFIDYSISSTKDRLFIINLKNNRCIYSCRCLHGRGGKSTGLFPECSNIPNSYQSSLGKYKIKSFYKGNKVKFGYTLKGLESSNSNAEKRSILLHPGHTYYSQLKLNTPKTKLTHGCFGTSLFGFWVIHQLDLTNSLLWCYE